MRKFMFKCVLGLDNLEETTAARVRVCFAFRLVSTCNLKDTVAHVIISNN